MSDISTWTSDNNCYSNPAISDNGDLKCYCYDQSICERTNGFNNQNCPCTEPPPTDPPTDPPNNRTLEDWDWEWGLIAIAAVALIGILVGILIWYLNREERKEKRKLAAKELDIKNIQEIGKEAAAIARTEQERQVTLQKITEGLASVSEIASESGSVHSGGSVRGRGGSRDSMSSTTTSGSRTSIPAYVGSEVNVLNRAFGKRNAKKIQKALKYLFEPY